MIRDESHGQVSVRAAVGGQSPGTDSVESGGGTTSDGEGVSEAIGTVGKRFAPAATASWR
ncbi:hypothetical protein ACFQH2_02580 [Natronoarchaeum sp. GCM10025703]|uniref:hypothetical protein n=1 Tax=unclassified Natronoarchaeum TaxID=2620183 RepID=UPI0036132328